MPETFRQPENKDSCAAASVGLTNGAEAFSKCLDARLAALNRLDPQNNPAATTESDTEKTWEAPADARALLESFGIGFNGKVLEIKGSNAEIPFDAETKNVSFSVSGDTQNGTGAVTISVENKDRTRDQLVLKNNSILLNDAELDFRGQTFAQLKESSNQSEKPIAQVQALFDKYGDKGWVGVRGKTDLVFTNNNLSPNQITVSRGVRGYDPTYDFDSNTGLFVNPKNLKEFYTPEQFDAFIQNTNHREQ